MSPLIDSTCLHFLALKNVSDDQEAQPNFYHNKWLLLTSPTPRDKIISSVSAQLPTVIAEIAVSVSKNRHNCYWYRSSVNKDSVWEAEIDTQKIKKDTLIQSLRKAFCYMQQAKQRWIVVGFSHTQGTEVQVKQILLKVVVTMIPRWLPMTQTFI